MCLNFMFLDRLLFELSCEKTGTHTHTHGYTHMDTHTDSDEYSIVATILLYSCNYNEQDTSFPDCKYKHI